MTIENPDWEKYASDLFRVKVGGGYIYCCSSSDTICFVPDIDLQRYESHLRDAYRKGFEDGTYEALKGSVDADKGSE